MTDEQHETDNTSRLAGTGAVLLTGAAGAAAVTLINEAARRLLPAAPRLDELGLRGITQIMRKAEIDPPPRRTRFWLSMAADLISNSLYYSLTGTGGGAMRRGMLLGLAAGLGAATLPSPMGLGRGPTERSAATRLMAVTWYFLGGLTAGAVGCCVVTRAQDG